MNAIRETEVALMKSRATVKQTSERELVVTRTLQQPARLVFDTWTEPELFNQ